MLGGQHEWIMCFLGFLELRVTVVLLDYLTGLSKGDTIFVLRGRG
jgi:hypothetical protein